MLYSLFGYAHDRAHLVRQLAGGFAARRFRGTVSERGQGTVEYVGLILLVSLLMVGMVAAMRGFNNNWPLGGYPAGGRHESSHDLALIEEALVDADFLQGRMRSLPDLASADHLVPLRRRADPAIPRTTPEPAAIGTKSPAGEGISTRATPPWKA